jgi:hypothetical protein
LSTPPRGIDPKVAKLAAEIGPNAQTARQKIDAVVSFFQNNFSYTLEPMDLPRDAEPLSYFLLNRTAAHCEFFASGAVALLRLQGVPARYVTGYVVTELEDEYGDYWLARNRNAHAWAEAYDDNRQQWVPVEATPGMYLPSADDTSGQIAWAESSGGRTSDGWGAGDSWFDKRWLGRRWATIGKWLRYPLLVCGLGIVALVGYQIWCRRQMPQSADARRLAQMQRALARLERRLRRRNFSRPPHETLHQFAHRLRQTSDGDDWLRRSADWCLLYAQARYSGRTVEGGFPPVPASHRKYEALSPKS